MFTSCQNIWSLPNDSGPEIDAIYDAIEEVARETLVVHRFILAVITQESLGCVRVHTRDGGVRSPELMQDHGGQTISGKIKWSW